MSTDDKRVRDCLEQINTRVDNWARGGEYGPGGFPKDTAEKDVAFLLAHIADLQVEAREKNAWEGRYRALLEEAEASRPRTVEGDGSDLPAGTVVIDKNGDAWQHYETSGWEVIGGCCCMHHALPDDGVPYAIVHTPEKKS